MTVVQWSSSERDNSVTLHLYRASEITEGIAYKIILTVIDILILADGAIPLPLISR